MGEMLPTLIFALITRVVSLNGNAVPVTTCCPEGSFLAIDDILGEEARQYEDGGWPRLHTDFSLPDLDRDSLGANFSYNNQRSRLPGYRRDQGYEGSRHEFVTGFKCVPSYRNQLPSLTGYPPFSPTLPYYVDAWAEAHLSPDKGKVVTRALEESQKLKSIGSWMPSCPPRQLSTIILGNEESNSYKSPRIRLTSDGHLVAQKFDFLGLGGMRRARSFNIWEREQFEGTAGNLTGPEIELDVKFCVTWSHDPRTKLEHYALPPEDGQWDEHPKAEEEQEVGGSPDLTPPPAPTEPGSGDGGGSGDGAQGIETLITLDPGSPDPAWLRYETLHEQKYRHKPAPLLLEVVYCDPCKDKVFCHYLSTKVWWELYRWANPVKCTPEQEQAQVDACQSDSSRCNHECDRRDHPLHIYLANYLDENQDGTVSQKEFVDKKAMPLVRSVFRALDRDSDGIVELAEAWMENILSPPFLSYLAAELFKFGDLNRDNFLSNEDIPRAIRPEFTGPRPWPEDPRGHGTIHYEYKEKFNKSFDFCIVLLHYYGPDLQEKCSRLMLEFLPEVDRNNDDKLSLAEMNHIFMAVLQFFGDPSCRITIQSLTKGLERLGEPREVSEALRRYLGPILQTLTRQILKSLVLASDSNQDGKTTLKELEEFSDFDLVAWRWPLILDSAKADLLEGMSTCRKKYNGSGMRDEKCFPTTPEPSLVLSYFTNPAVAERLLRAFFNHSL